jgi:hypothetical protein
MKYVSLLFFAAIHPCDASWWIRILRFLQRRCLLGWTVPERLRRGIGW